MDTYHIEFERRGTFVMKGRASLKFDNGGKAITADEFASLAEKHGWHTYMPTDIEYTDESFETFPPKKDDKVVKLGNKHE